MSWELTDKGIISIATNQVQFIQIEFTKQYIQSSAEFMRVSGFEDLTPVEVEEAKDDLLECIEQMELTKKELQKS